MTEKELKRENARLKKQLQKKDYRLKVLYIALWLKCKSEAIKRFPCKEGCFDENWHKCSACDRCLIKDKRVARHKWAKFLRDEAEFNARRLADREIGGKGK